MVGVGLYTETRKNKSIVFFIGGKIRQYLKDLMTSLNGEMERLSKTATQIHENTNT